MEIARPIRRLAGWEHIWLCLLMIIVLATHFAVILRPDVPMFDEQYYVPDARSILDGNGTTRSEHPPLGKLIIASGILIFGDNPIGWRFFSVLFGALGIIFFYLICRRLAMPRAGTLLAVFLLSLENLTFVQASIAMLDVYCVTFMLAAFWLYLRGDFPLAAVCVGLSTLAKLTGALALLAIGVHWLLAGRGRPWHFISSMFLVPVSILVLLPLFDFIVSGHLVDPIYSMKTMLSLSSTLTFSGTEHPSLSRPWDWVLRPLAMPYWYEPHYTGAISFTVWAFIIPGMVYMVFRATRHCHAALFSIVWFAGTYLVWIPLSILTDRISFVFYFYPAVGAVCIALGLGLSRLVGIWRTRRDSGAGRAAIAVVVVYLIAHVAVFVVLSPMSGWQVV